MANQFYMSSTASTSTSSLSSADPDSLPFPKPLNRTSFLEPSFDAAVFLSTLTNRFQTLEDLRSELASLSQTIEHELVDLVNDNYSDFLTLGSSLQGGEEKIEEVRVGLLSIERDIKGLREKVVEERRKVVEALGEKRKIMQDISTGRGILEVDRTLRELEIDLGLSSRDKAMVTTTTQDAAEDDDEDIEEHDWGTVWDDDIHEDDEEEHDDQVDAVPPRLRRKIDKFLSLRTLCERSGREHPLLAAEQSRIRKVKETVLLDVDAAIRAASSVQGKQAILRRRAEIEE